MGAHKRGDGRKLATKGKAPCRADTRGGGWAGIPICVIKSRAYRELSLHARAALVEIVAEMRGYNNGEIGVSQRELVEALRCHNRRAIAAVVELIDHGMIAVTAEGQWQQRKAREYRLTFVSTANAPASNDYLAWAPHKAKFSDATPAPDKTFSGATVASADISSDATVASKIKASRGRVVKAADANVAPPIEYHICNAAQMPAASDPSLSNVIPMRLDPAPRARPLHRGEPLATATGRRDPLPARGA